MIFSQTISADDPVSFETNPTATRSPSQTGRLRALFCTFTALFISIGCGNEMKVAPVSGTLTLDGEPVEQASVVFEPEEGGRPSFGVTNAQGRYTLAYSRTLNGAEVGDCVVKITKLSELDENGNKPKEKTSNAPAPGEIPKRYLKEPIKVTVLPRSNQIDIDLTTE